MLPRAQVLFFSHREIFVPLNLEERVPPSVLDPDQMKISDNGIACSLILSILPVGVRKTSMK